MIAEVVAVRDGKLVCMPFGELRGVCSEAAPAPPTDAAQCRSVRRCSAGVLYGLGRPLDGGP